jgi:hypothetical protein
MKMYGRTVEGTMTSLLEPSVEKMPVKQARSRKLNRC